MKMRRLLVNPVVLSLLVVVLAGLVWGAGAPARAATIANTVVIPVSGTVSGQPESVAFSGKAQISSELVLDPKHTEPPGVILIVDLSNVSGTGSSTGTTYVAGNGSNLRRLLVSADTVQITFPFFRSTTLGISPAARSGLASFALSFDLNTGAITNATASIATPNFPN